MRTLTSYTIKHIDEMGDCYLEETIESIKARNERLREWAGGYPYSTVKTGDITVLSKINGEEVWFYVNKDI